MSLFSTDVQKVETVIKTDAESALKQLDNLAAAVKNGQIQTEFLNILAILQPFITVAEQGFPQYAPTIEWAEALLKEALQVKL